MKKNLKRKQDVFSKRQFSDAYPDGMENHYWTLARNRIIEAKIKKSISADEVILDIGTGRGSTVKWLTHKGFNCFGCELGSPKIDTDIKSRIFISKDAFNLPPNFRSQVKVILLLDVLEHIKDSKSLLKKCRSKFPNLKTIIATVPSDPKLWSNYDSYYGHYRRYDMDSFKELLRTSGFKITDCGYFFHSLYIPARLLMKFAKKRPVRLSPPSFIIMHRLIALVLYLETFIVPKTWPGTSLIATASKIKAT